eukprot:9124295-Pyramimonas_sp.AAC.1
MDIIDLTSDDDEPLSVRVQASKRPRVASTKPSCVNLSNDDDDEVQEIEPMEREIHQVEDSVNDSDDVAITGVVGQ